MLGTSGTTTTLAVGGDNGTSTFYGQIGQVTGGTGSLTRMAAGP